MATDSRIASRDREDLLPEGYYVAGPTIAPFWLAGRRVKVEHETHDGSWWCVILRVRCRGGIIDEYIERWDGVPA